MSNIIYIDTEYSAFFNTLPGKSGEILQLGAVAMVDGVEAGTFNEFARPLTKVWSKDAEKVHRISRDRAELHQNPDQLAEHLIAWVESFGDVYFQVKGWNCKGDKQYIERLMFDHGMLDRWYAMTRVEWIDVIKKARARKDYLPVANFQLETVAKHFGIKMNAHDGLSDAWATVKVDDYLDTIKLPSKHVQTSMKHELTEKQKVKKYMSSEYVQVGGDGSIFIQPRATATPEALQTIFSELYTRYVVNGD